MDAGFCAGGSDGYGFHGGKKEAEEMNNMGQLSWVWVVLVMSIALALFTGLWITIDNAQNKMHPQAINNGVNVGNLSMFEGFLSAAPFVAAASFALYVWTTAASSSRGEYL